MVQPHIDMSNRWRQRILAIEERFRTNCFPFRCVQTVIAGMSIVSAHTAYAFHVADTFDFRDFVEQVAFEGMTNTWDVDHAPAGPSPAGAGRAPTPQHTPAAAGEHIPVSIKTIKSIHDFVGHWQQKCAHCPRATCYACSHPSCVAGGTCVPLCLPTTQLKGNTITHPCLAKHKRDPESSQRTIGSAARSVAAKKRRRAN